MEKQFKIHGAYGSTDIVLAKSAAAARKQGQAILGEPVVRVELVEENLDDEVDVDTQEETEEE